MRRIWIAAALLLAGCGIADSGAVDAGPAPTGVAPGPTLYFVNDEGELRPAVRETGRLGTIAEALSLLLSGPGNSSLRTEIDPVSVTTVEVTVGGQVIGLRVPLSVEEVTPLGIDQIVCTALAAHVQGGGSTEATVRIGFTLDAPESDVLRTCPLIE